MKKTRKRKEKKEPKQRILEAAIRLFSQKGYSATGVRELAKAAHVNIAMINYYFGSKIQILKDIIDSFFSSYRRIVENAVNSTSDIPCLFSTLIHDVIRFFSNNPRLMIIALTEIPYEVPGISKFKADRVQHIKNLMIEKILNGSNIPGTDQNVAVMIGPALMGMMASHFIFKPVLENLDGVLLDDRFYKRLPKVITEIFLHGLLNPALTGLLSESDSGGNHEN